MVLPGIYNQRDPRWGNMELGYNTDSGFTIYHYGCLITAVANMLWWNGNAGADPGAVNNWLLDDGGFVPGGGIMKWDAIQPLLDQVQMVAHGFSTDLGAVNVFLQDDNNYAIAQLTKSGFPMHFSAMPYVDMIADSWDGVLKHVEEYTFQGAHLYSKVLPAPAPAPVAPPVVPSPPQPPIVAPSPAQIPVESPASPAPEQTKPVPVAVIPVKVVPEPLKIDSSTLPVYSKHNRFNAIVNLLERFWLWFWRG